MSKSTSSIPFKTAYATPARVQLEFPFPSLTKQSFRDEVDINNVLAKYRRTGLLEYVNRFEARYGDFMHAEDYQSALNKIGEARDLFDALPSKLRARFDNDPGQFLDFVQNPANVGEMVELGLATKRNEVSQPTDSNTVTDSGS